MTPSTPPHADTRAIAIYIEYEPLPGCLDALQARMQNECDECIREDEGCLRMELCLPDPPDGRLLLAELWRDQAALDAHKNKPGHSHEWQKALVAAKRVSRCRVVVSPQKPGVPLPSRIAP